MNYPFSIPSSRCYQQFLTAVPTLLFILLLSLLSLSEDEGHHIEYLRKIKSNSISILHTWFQFKAYIALQFGVYAIIDTLQLCPSLQLIYSDLNQHRRQVLFCFTHMTILIVKQVAYLCYIVCLVFLFKQGFRNNSYKVNLKCLSLYSNLSIYSSITFP